MNLKLFPFLIVSIFSNFISAEIFIDGKLEELEWQNAQIISDFVTVYPNDKSQPKFKTEVRIFSNEKGMYFGFTNVQPIETHTLLKHPRDKWWVDADRNFIIIDFDGNANAGYEFSITLGDTLRDAIWTNENEKSESWDAIWYGKTRQIRTAWFSEVFIPWEVAPMNNIGDEQRKIKVSFMRKHHKENKYYSFPGSWYEQSPYLSKFSSIKVKNPSNIKTSRVDYFPYLSISNNFVENNRKINFGGEIFWDINSGAKLDISFNPDFGQVESDDLVVNFSAIETFYKDKRPFFTENQTLFDITGWNLYFINTRRIGGMPDKCSPNNETLKGQCSNSLIDSSDIDLALRYTQKSRENEFGFFSAFEANSLYSSGRDYFAGRYRRNIPEAKGNIGYMLTAVDRSSINREAYVHTIDFDFKPSSPTRVYGWLSQSNIKDDSIDSTGIGARLVATRGFSDQLFVLGALNYLDEDFDINDMGYMEENNKISLGGYLQYINPIKDSSSKISQTIFRVNGGHNRSTEGYGNGIGIDTELELFMRDNSYISLKCNCTIKRGKNFTETRNFALAPYIESLANYDLQLAYYAPRTDKIRPYVKFGLATGGYRTENSNINLRHETVNFGLGLILTTSSKIRASLNFFEFQKENNWEVFQRDNLFGYFDKKMITSGLDIDWFPGSNQEFRLKAFVYGIKANNARAFEVNQLGYMSSSLENVDDFQLSEIAFQIRYKYEFSPLSNLYVVYTRGGKSSGTLEDSFDGLYANAWNNQVLDKLILKIRYKF
tara:strand:+ start:2448 stop:4769 length:2322 start_codon:yes stop_codon:yes gene_type:complete